MRADPGRTSPRDDLLGLAAAAGLRRIAMVAWRDLDDPEAGGSELHAHEIARRWAAAGIDVVLRTSRVDGQARSITRDGYQAVRHGGRYAVFAEAPLELMLGRLGHLDGLIEIWNGMPFLSPLWFRGPRAVFLHHVHAEMWQMVLPQVPRLARAGRVFEARLAPRLYRRTPVVTLSATSRSEIIDMLGLRPRLVSVVPPGIDRRFSPGGERSSRPLLVAVGRLVPVKRFERLVRAAAELADVHPGLEVVIVGEGYERPALESAIAAARLDSVVRLPGRLSDDAVVDLYRRAWAVVSTSAREGWGMTLTEAAACGTPAVASRIAGHLDAVEDGDSGLLFDTDRELVAGLDQVIRDGLLRARLAKGAIEQARRFSWDATATGALAALCRAAVRGPGSWPRPQPGL
ncbi:MAG: glycosyltransferase family 4 protein [Actinomycetota bacterium]|nr:glycosyltransferase family 4 protein [Actinomycetota bacterium]